MVVNNCNIYKATLQYVTVIYNGLDTWHPMLDTDFHNTPCSYKFYMSFIYLALLISIHLYIIKVN